MINHRKNQLLKFFTALLVLVFNYLTAFAQQAVTATNSTNVTVGIGTTYNANGATGSGLAATNFDYRYGNLSGAVSNKVYLNHFIAGGTSFVFEYSPVVTVVLNRVDNASVTGARDLVFNEGAINTVPAPDQMNINAPHVPLMTNLLPRNDDLRSGADNLFGNTGDADGNNNNIERIDVLLNGTEGYFVFKPERQGFAVFERGAAGAHDAFTVSVITAVDGSGNPTGYTGLIRVVSADYGVANPVGNANYVVSRRDGGVGNLLASATPAAEGIGGVFFEFNDFGIAANTTIYGYSIAAADFPIVATAADMVAFTSATNFPTTTASGGSGGLDLAGVTGVFKIFDDDFDGLTANIDIDDDNDGITDLAENGGFDAFADADVDGLPNLSDPSFAGFTDADLDGINDNFDTDQDGVVNQIDLDTDNDAIPDIIEAGGVDTNGDGRIDGAFADTDGDGLHNTYDATTGGDALTNLDTDGDGVPNSKDLDSDNDGVSDIREADGESIDTHNTGVIESYFDSDGDGYSNDQDGDTDNDGTAENLTGPLILTGTDVDSDGAPDSFVRGDQDADDHANLYDLDSDADGLLDVAEAGFADSNNDGIIDGTIGTNGWSNIADGIDPLLLPNADGHGLPDYRDIDSDNDGIVDNIEGQSTAGYIPPVVTDSDGDGIDNAYDNNDAAFAGSANNGVAPNNQESNGNPDYTDTDTDNDGSLDVLEGWDTNGNGVIDGLEIAFVGTTDTDNDGLFNEYDIDDVNPEPTNGTTPASYPDIDITTTQRAWREPVDNDEDGVVDGTDVDDDNDAIPDLAETGGVDPFADADSDGAPNFLDPTPGPGVPAFVDVNGDNINDAFDADLDGVINNQDLDSDNDGISDLAEAGGVDTNGDGRVDGIFTDTDTDGLHDTYDASNGGDAIANRDTDVDGIANAMDTDSDNDGIPDVVEAAGTDANNNGIIDFYFDSDGDGFSNDVDGDIDNDGTAENTVAALIITGTDGNSDGVPDTYPRANQDANGLPNPYDLDSDADGILDVREAGIADSNNDGVADGTLGADGWSDAVDALPTLTLPDTDGFATGKPNYLDIDSDDDGIVDNIEGQSTAGYVAPAGTDSDGDGIDNSYDNNDAAFAGSVGNGVTPNNQENDADPDYLDGDSDEDGSLDEVEGWDTNADGFINGGEIAFIGTTDTDGDGLFDEYDADDVNSEPTNGTTPASYPDADLGTAERKWREPIDNDDDDIVNSVDVDDDNDGIPDALENPGGVDPTADADSDGTPNFLDPTPGAGVPAFVDSNGDNINDAFDTDLDSKMDLFDLDSDNDGISDLAEAGGVDTEGDGRVGVGAFIDTDADGLHDTYDASNGGDAIANSDTDVDGIVNSKDLDSDNDGIPDVVEAAGTDANNDGKIDGFTDTDNDGFAQSVDGDINNDGTADNTAAALIITGTDGNSDGLPDTYPRANADANGLPNAYDLDADNDGILDAREAGITDTNGDGIADGTLGGDGWSDTVDGLATLTPTDTDGSTRPDYLDIDADNDGIVDIIEGQSTAGYIAPAGADADNDGIDNAYDNNDAAFAGGANNGITPVADSDDGDTIPDYVDLDADADGKTDRIEGWDTNGNGVIDGAEIAFVGTTDADNDGLLNEYDADDVNPEPTNGTTPASYPDVNNPGDDRDWRQSGDADSDGVLDLVDADDDNDGIPDATEGSGDADADGRPDSRDRDSDNDGIADLLEAGGVDTDGDGRVDGLFADGDGDGLHNTYDVTDGGDAIANRDTDGDGIANAYDKDSDADGIPDVVEALGSDGNNDGIIDFYFDSDNDGFSNDIDGDSDNDGTAENSASALIITGADTDSDGQPNSYPRANNDKLGLPNPYDLDADGDGIQDAREAGLTDATNDGIADGTLGADGWSDSVDGLAAPLGLPNSDLSGPPDMLDIDSDDDGITDNVEGQSTAGDLVPLGVDTDGDGIEDLYDNNDAAFAGGANNGIVPNNHDGADTPDYIDANSDNDSVNDLKEGTGDPNATLTNVADADGDGLVDQFDVFDLAAAATDIPNNVTIAGMGNGGSTTGPTPAGSNVLAPQTPVSATDRDWRNNSFVLPVRFIEVRLTVTSTGNVVAWTVADELNVKEYIVERSFDGVNFVATGTVAYLNNGGGQQTYTFNDAPTNGTVYYRIRQVDIDGRSMISKVVFYKEGQKKTGLFVIGNPVRNNEVVLNISAEREGFAELRLLDMNGKLLMIKKQNVSIGNTTIRLTGSGGFLANGVYFVRAVINEQLFVEKIIIDK